MGEMKLAIGQGCADSMHSAGMKTIVERDGEPFSIHTTIDEELLSWAAREFAKRANESGIAIDEAAIGERIGADPPRLDNMAATKAETALKRVIQNGDGRSMVAHASRVVAFWAPFHQDLPRLRVLTWIAHTLGERCERGDFDAHTQLSDVACALDLDELNFDDGDPVGSELPSTASVLDAAWEPEESNAAQVQRETQRYLNGVASRG